MKTYRMVCVVEVGVVVCIEAEGEEAAALQAVKLAQEHVQPILQGSIFLYSEPTVDLVEEVTFGERQESQA